MSDLDDLGLYSEREPINTFGSEDWVIVLGNDRGAMKGLSLQVGLDWRNSICPATYTKNNRLRTEADKGNPTV